MVYGLIIVYSLFTFMLLCYVSHRKGRPRSLQHAVLCVHCNITKLGGCQNQAMENNQKWVLDDFNT